MKRLMELRDKRGKAIADARAILDIADKEKRELTEEDNAAYEAFIEDANKLKTEIDREEAQSQLEKDAAELALGNTEEEIPEINENPRASKLYNEAFAILLADGPKGLTPEHIKAVSTGTDDQGGYLVAPEQMINKLIKAVDNIVYIRKKSTVYQLKKAVSLGAPSLDTDVDDADWTTELATGSLDTALRFGKRNLYPHPFAKRIKMSNHLLRNSAIPVDTLVMQRLAYKVGVTEEKAFMTGTGAQQPLGVFTASDSGISTSRDVSTGNTTTSPTFDGLIEAKYTLKGQYWGRADWIFHRDVLKTLVKIKDGDGQYIWRDGVSSGEPDTLLGRPTSMSEYAPNTMTTGLYVGILGDFTNYWIADALDMQMQILKELYAETNQTGIILRKETDAMPVLEEAFVRVTLA